MNLKKFKIKHSELICYFQLIEYNLKLIYSVMLEGKFKANFAKVENLSLTQILIELKELDNSDRKPFISKENYKLLSEMLPKRNYWCHDAYLDFYYEKGFKYRRKYKKVSKELDADYKVFKNISKTIESIKDSAMEKYY